MVRVEGCHAGKLRRGDEPAERDVPQGGLRNTINHLRNPRPSGVRESPTR
ncbi:MAG: hypothetical protein JWM31_1750, partial [Solirubrobacterales bacterium]|nr:hypothetical protein [Solirubrobacterales bacterium]